MERPPTGSDQTRVIEACSAISPEIGCRASLLFWSGPLGIESDCSRPGAGPSRSRSWSRRRASGGFGRPCERRSRSSRQT